MASFDRPLDPDIPPSAWVMRWAALIRAGGTVLDVAAGHGRHTRSLAALGLQVTAVDVDISALTDTPAEVIAADLEAGAWPFTGRTFDAVVVTNYLHRPHFPYLLDSLAENGVLIFETFGQGNERLGRPRNPDFLLAPGELLQAFKRLTVVAYEHGEEQASRPAVRQRICAVNGVAPRLIA